jgi:hypothetical protein
MEREVVSLGGVLVVARGQITTVLLIGYLFVHLTVRIRV